jgi:hypothetical protein
MASRVCQLAKLWAFGAPVSGDERTSQVTSLMDDVSALNKNCSDFVGKIRKNSRLNVGEGLHFPGRSPKNYSLSWPRK